jgi:hypothetical protein
MAKSYEEGIDGPVEILAEFGQRRDNASGVAEKFRIVVTPRNGRLETSLRHWYWFAKPTPEDDGYKPTMKGVTVRESELNETIAALEEVRRRVQAEGRPTSRPPEGHRNPRPKAIARQRAKEAAERLAASAAPKAPSPPRAVQLDALDDLSEFRRKRPR